MKVLVIYAHPKPESFNHAVLAAFTEGLKKAGHTSEVVDLYQIKFNPCLIPEDFAQFTGGQMPRDVLEQQKKVVQADALALIYPIWHWGYPAILKGWMDRVFSRGFAFKLREGAEGVEGLLKHEKALLISTTGGGKALFQDTGREDALNKLEKAFFNACGTQNVERVFLYSVEIADATTRKGYLELAYRLGKEF